MTAAWHLLACYERLRNLAEFQVLPEEMIKSSGYVVDSLEAAVWSLINSNSFVEAELKAVNLGDDSDTIGAITGGLAGLHLQINAKVYLAVNWPKEPSAAE